MSKLTAAYLAGLLDGEGSIEIVRRSRKEMGGKLYYMARIRICMTDKEIIDWLKDSFGGHISKRESHGKNRESWSWAMCYTNIKPLLDKVYPYLKVKRKHATILKKFLSTFESNSFKIVANRTRPGSHKELKDGIWKYREELYQKIKSANKRGFCTLRD